MNKKFGRGTLTKLGSTADFADIERVPTGCLTLDYALGGGVPRGRIIEIYGPESSGKTTLALCIMAQAQQLGDEVCLIDAEHAYDPKYGAKMGLDPANLFYCQPEHGDAALEMVDELCRSGCFGVITVDSVAALVPRAELERDMGDPMVGTSARLMSSGLKRIAASASRHNTTVIFINQLRMKIGVLYGSPETTTGGMALKYYSSQRIDVRKVKAIDGADKEGPAKGLKIKAKIVKNKVGAPHAVATFDIMFDRGLDRFGCLLDAATMMNVVEKRGAHIYFTDGDEEVKLGHGRDAAVAFLEQEANAALAATIEAATRQAWQGAPPPLAPIAPDSSMDGDDL